MADKIDKFPKFSLDNCNKLINASYKRGKRDGIQETKKEVEKAVDNVDNFKWVQEFKKRQERGCMDEEAFDFTLREIKEELKSKLGLGK